ncbi:hypothetical protein TrST_g5858 [Triparma strigata]|uniref:Gamma-glutamylcyclotransferase n=1 Tax=Triparma strigata TaxID=1606541 RepID=A0A9W7B6F9_9STRA|nr:hypothetical protein TrST_g5858 [Triparma strigata]
MSSSSSSFSSNPPVYIFGYGSLCWKPSPDLEDSVEICQGFLTDGLYTRVWAQYSCDHRGTETNYGVVCNLLKHSELENYFATHGAPPPNAFDYRANAAVLGTLYLLADDVREKALAELDVREKGGYSREIVQVYKVNGDDFSLSPVTALLYRGRAPSDEVTRAKVGNFWGRVLYDDLHKVAVMASSVGPSGWNGSYVFELNKWLKLMEEKYSPNPSVPKDETTKIVSSRIAAFIRKCRTLKAGLLFFYVLGNNENGQLALANPEPEAVARPFDVEKCDQISGGLWENFLLCPSYATKQKGESVPTIEAQDLQCGGSHSGVVSKCGKCWLWGGNGEGQVGGNSTDRSMGVKLEDEDVAGISLGHDHTMVLKLDGTLRCFGNNDFGACEIPEEVKRSHVSRIAAGPRNSACITRDRRAFVWGCGKYSQNSPVTGFHVPEGATSWISARCGMRSTLLLDDAGRVWGLGDARHGQLGGAVEEGSKRSEDLVLIWDGEAIVGIDCGWSHCVAWTADGKVWGWGRDDKGQLGERRDGEVGKAKMRRIFEGFGFGSAVKTVMCGPETTYVLEERGAVWGTGWNEHGNLGVGDCIDRFGLVDVKVQGSLLRDGVSRIAVGGAHLIVL